MSERTSQLKTVWLLIADCGILAAIFVAPLFMGGRGPVGKLAVIVAAVVAAVAWAVHHNLGARSCWRWSGVEFLLLLGGLLVLAQLVPMPRGLVDVLSPTLTDRLPLWSTGARGALHLGEWTTLSLAPGETRGGLMVYLAYVMLFVVVVQRIATVSDVEMVVRWVAVAAVGMALVGLLQFLVGNEKFLWIYEHPSRSAGGVVKGPFQNQNHFAQFLALGIGPLIWWIWKRSPEAAGPVSTRTWSAKRTRQPPSPQRSRTDLAVPWQVVAIALGIVLLAGLLTFSRGGVIGMGSATILCLSVYFVRGYLGGRALGTMVAAFGLLVVALGIHGYARLTHKLETIVASDSLAAMSRGRSALWQALFDAIPDFALFGSGVGTHRFVYPVYLDEYFDVNFSHGESGYLPLLLETGGVGLLLMLAGIVTAFGWCGAVAFRNRGSAGVPEKALAVALLSSLAASAIHSVGDFVWYISSCMALTVILAACACRLFQLTRNPDSSPGPFPATHSATGVTNWGATLAVVVVGCAMIWDRLPAAQAAPHWDQYRAASRQAEALQGRAERERSQDYTELMLRHLEQALGCQPDHCRANLRAAALYLRSFEHAQQTSPNPMGLSQIRDAALQSQFTSKAQQDEWLERAIGERRRWLDKARIHALRAARASPLQGEAYTYLAELSFLDSPRIEDKEAFLAQAGLVRPHDGPVLFALGREQLLAGDAETALSYWRRAFRLDPEVQGLIIELLANQAPVQFFVDHFQPDRVALGRIYYQFRDVQRPTEARVAGQHYLRALLSETLQVEGPEAAELWRRASEVYTFLEEGHSALECLNKAVALAPRDYATRRALARSLIEKDRYEEAIPVLEWCLHRNADDLEVRKDLELAGKRLLAARPSARPTGPPPLRK